MPTLNELLTSKADRLESVPNKFTSEIEKVQLQLIKEIEVILAQFDLDGDGNFIISEANVSLAAELDVKLRQALDRSEYGEAVTEFAKQFNVQIGVNDAYFTKAFKGFETSEIGKMIVRQAQKNAIELLINTSPDADFIIPIKQQIENAVINGARWRETIEGIQNLVVGYTDERGTFKDGKILQYSKQISHDTFAVADRSYASAVAEQVGAKWFKWSGSAIPSSRVFCVERHNKFYCKKEIEMWGDGERTEGFETPQAGTWEGEFLGTNSRTIFSVAGGYNCRHSVMAVSIFTVPVASVKRAVELGYYTPTKFEVEELGI
jgi:hypothetical protein